jgi:hypothetical protein
MLDMSSFLQVARGAFDAADVMDGPGHPGPVNAFLTVRPWSLSVPTAPAVRPRGRTFGEDREARMNPAGDHD